jgi:hypothetical protein
MAIKTSSTHKKVVVETLDGARHFGYLNVRNFDRKEGLELLDAGGQVQQFPWKDVKIAWFVQDWDAPVRPQQTVFQRRPRVQGLWVRLRFHDEEVLEGILVNDLARQGEHGFLLTPPDLSGSHQKAFVPRAALAALEVLGVIPGRGEERPQRRPQRLAPEAQQELFKE